jgi:hypothetical protein
MTSFRAAARSGRGAAEGSRTLAAGFAFAAGRLFAPAGAVVRERLETAMRVFLAGIMQGSHVAALVHDQHYRAELADVVRRRWPEAEVYDPHAGHANSVAYRIDEARVVFERHVQMCREFDLVVAWVPEASMGTAVEVWEAHRGRAVVTITPLVHNWVVLLTSLAVYRDQEAFVAALESGDVDRLLTRHAAGRRA